MNLNKFKDKNNSEALEKIIYIWLYKDDNFPNLITKKEISKSEILSKNRKKRFCFSRGSARLALSELLSIPPLEVPLIANPGEPPILEKGLGHISFSHCKDVFLLAWSYEKIGIDIELSKRKIKNKKIFKKYLFREEDSISNKSNDYSNSSLLMHWVLKESAIKWDKGTLLSDIGNWLLEDNFRMAINKKLNIKVPIMFLSYKNYFIGIANNQINSKEAKIIFKN